MVYPGAVWVVFSDIHANANALEAAIEDAEGQAGDIGVAPEELHYISLGDAVDYGPDPVQCLDWVESHCTIKICGNHDREASKHLDERIELVKKAFWPVSLWTRCQLNKAQRELLQKWDLPTIVTLGAHQLALGHATLVQTDDRQDANVDRKTLIAPLEATEARCGLVGHSHVQAIWLSDYPNPLLPDEPAPLKRTTKGWTSLISLLKYQNPDGRSVVFNPGGLGQPRCLPGKPLAPCVPYLLIDTRGPELFYKFRQAHYCHNLTVEKIRTISLPTSLPRADCSTNKNRLTDREIADIYADLDAELRDLVLALCTPPLRQEV